MSNIHDALGTAFGELFACLLLIIERIEKLEKKIAELEKRNDM